jgi:8-oxo-dGTP pyrophosphatase MutT (NUDIX family)
VAEPNPADQASRPVEARPASTVIVARDGPAGCEVLMVRRLADAAAFAGAWVFPGGSVRDDDRLPAGPGPGGLDPDGDFTPAEAFAALSDRGGQPPASPSEALALFRAAQRELFEEAGLLLARDADGRPIEIPVAAADRWADWRRRLQAGGLSLSQLLRAVRVALDHRRLTYFSHWITPLGAPRRFDTRFFVAGLPPGQTAEHCQIETTQSIWISPQDALTRAAAGEFSLVLPTRLHLARLQHLPNLAALRHFAASKRIHTVLPERWVPGGITPLRAGEPATDDW